MSRCVELLWVPATVREQPPALTTSERMLVERLIRAEVRAARAEEALRWAREDVLGAPARKHITEVLQA